MEVQMRWDRLVEGIGHLRRLLRQYLYSIATVGAGFAEPEIEAAWDGCCEALECVPGAQDDHSLLLNRLKNARRYFQEGERWPAVWEVTQSLQRAKRLRRLYGRE
jgi:hypothetical protein